MNFPKLQIVAIVTAFILSSTIFGQPPPSKSNRQIVQPVVTDQLSRVALVIGNGDYKFVSRLSNPVNDARDMANSLRELGFDVIAGENSSAEEMKRLIISFGEKLAAKKGVGVFFYAGHGVQLSGHNYLIPIEAAALREQTIEFDGVDVNRVLAQMDGAGNGFNVVILDACRNNPFSRSWRGGAEGLANISAPTGTLIAYATAPGAVASDGEGRNGLYTAALLKSLQQPGLKIEELFKQVRKEVAGSSHEAQIPWESSSLRGDFYFNPLDSKQPASVAANNTKPISSARVSDKTKNPPSSPKNTGSVLRSRPKFKGQLQTFNFDTPLIEASGSQVVLNKGQATFFTEKLNADSNLDMIEVDGGLFRMGSTENEARQSWRQAQEQFKELYQGSGKTDMSLPAYDKYIAETPAREITIKPFFMSKYEITQAQWKAVMGELPPGMNSVYFALKDDNFPAFAVTWDEAQEFCRRLSVKTGKKYRLPSEVEWEYAARAGSTTAYSFGDFIDNSVANYAVAPNANNLKPDLSVDRLRPNGFGLFGMHGNVGEWCQDIWETHSQTPNSENSPRKTKLSEKVRVVKGGGFSDVAADCRSAARAGFNTDTSTTSIGLRVIAEFP